MEIINLSTRILLIISLTMVMSTIRIAYINICGQSGLNTAKKLQIQDFLRQNRIDVCHFQEIETETCTFNECSFISSMYNLVSNNSYNKYGTASLVSYNLPISNVQTDNNGRVIVIDIENIKLTTGNVYLPSGTDNNTKNLREKYAGEILPDLLLLRMNHGCYGGGLKLYY